MRPPAEQPVLETSSGSGTAIVNQKFAQRFRRRIGLEYLYVIQRILGDADLKPGERVLDITSEDATLALRMAAQVMPGQVVSVCPIEEILQQAYRQAQAVGLEEHIDWRIAAIEELPFPDEAFDAVTCALAFRLLNMPAFAKEAYRLLVPDGQLIITESLVPSTWVTRWRVALRHLYYKYIVKDEAEAEAEFCSADELAALLQEAGFNPILIRGLQRPLTQHSWVFSLIKAFKQ